MDIARAAITRPVNTWLLMVGCLLGGLWGLSDIGRLEDPAFTLKLALVSTEYPGATAMEVEEEVTEPLESAIQQLPQLRRVFSRSRPGESIITVQVQDRYDGDTLPQVWDELRRRVNDTRPELPEGAHAPRIQDDYGDVFGLFYAITAPGYSDAETRELSRLLRRELLTVPDVAKVTTAGEPREKIYVEIAEEQLASLGLPLEQVLNTIQTENAVQQGGSLEKDGERLRITVRPGLDSVRAIESLRIGRPGSTEQISLRDIARVYRDTTDTPDHLVRHNGEPAFTLAVSGLQDANIVTIGRNVEAHLEEIRDRIPLGVELHPIYRQHQVVDKAINSFLFSLLLSLTIVIGVLCLTMGWRIGSVVGATLLLTVSGTVFFMNIFSIEMERISLGALIIAMGMLVDNAIVVAEGMLINIQRGMNARDAASASARRTQLPLLGATVIGIMAFAAIGLSRDITGEFLFSLFAVIGISLLLSWVLAVTATPLLGHYVFHGHEHDGTVGEPYRQSIYLHYRNLLTSALRYRGRTLAVLATITALCIVGFAFVRHAFFPPSNTPLFYINYSLRQGTDILETARHAEDMQHYVRDFPQVEAVTSFIGRGASRFMLTYEPELPNPAYAQQIVRVGKREQIPPLIKTLRRELPEQFPDGEIYVQEIMFGPGVYPSIAPRFSGPDSGVLREIGKQAIALLEDNPAVTNLRTNWRQPEKVVVPRYDEERSRMAAIGRNELAAATQFATTGVPAGTYRERDRRIPITARAPETERNRLDRLGDRLVWSQSEQAHVPMSQIIDGFEITAEEAMIHRRNRVRTLSVQAEPAGNRTADQALRQIRDDIEGMTLPAGYALEWGGEYEEQRRAQSSLASQLPVSFLVMLVITILLFGAVRQALVIWLIVPMSICGVTLALLLTGQPFTFLALLGFLSLSGMLIKNAIVLVDEIDTQVAEGKSRAGALVDGSVSRLRPVFLASFTTILGMIPLLWDAFFSSMAVTIMGGLAFATLLTLVAVPVLYAVLFRVPEPQEAERA